MNVELSTGTIYKIEDKRASDAKNSFQLFDKKGDGFISTKKLHQVFKSLGLQVDDEDLQNWSDEVDVDATGWIDQIAFLKIVARKLKLDEDEKEIKEAFRVLDRNHNGFIDVQDMRWIMQRLGDDVTEDEIDDMIAETDTDGSGTIDYDEFKTLMMS